MRRTKRAPECCERCSLKESAISSQGIDDSDDLAILCVGRRCVCWQTYHPLVTGIMTECHGRCQIDATPRPVNDANTALALRQAFTASWPVRLPTSLTTHREYTPPPAKRKAVLDKTCGKTAVIRVVGAIMALSNVTAADDRNQKTSLTAIGTCAEQGRSVFEDLRDAVYAHLRGEPGRSLLPGGP